MEIGVAELVVGAAAVWRLAHLLHAEDGPWDAASSLAQAGGQRRTWKNARLFLLCKRLGGVTDSTGDERGMEGADSFMASSFRRGNLA